MYVGDSNLFYHCPLVRFLLFIGVTASNALTNLTHLELYYSSHHPESGFSVAWNQVECMTHVINLAAQEILKQFKHRIDKES
jgi:hypothetical protein